MLSKNEFKKLLLGFLIWRGGLFLAAWLANFVLPYQPSFPYANELQNYHLPQWLYSWANFDGVHYLTIINKGYFGTGLIQAFFPLFPNLVKMTNFVWQNSLISGLVVSNLFSFLLIVSFYQVGKQLTQKNLNLAVLLLLIFPTSFFFGAFYTESLFLVLILQSFLAAQKKRWWLASVFAGFASATRIVGIFSIISVIFVYLFDNKNIWQLNKKILFETVEKLKSNLSKILTMLFIGSLGLILYMIYLEIRYQDALYFLHVQSEFGGGRQESLVSYPQVIWRYLKILITARPFDLKYFAYVQEALFGFLAPLVLYFISKKFSIGVLIFCLGAILIPTLTGTFSSLPRYALVIWPAYFLLANHLQSRRWKWFLIVLSLALLTFNTILFIQGYWVA